MFKNSILRYLNSAAVFDAESDHKAAVEAQRKSIQVETVKPEDSVGKLNEQEEPEEKKEEKEEEENEEEDEEKEEDEEGEKLPENETDEQKKERIAKEKEAKRDARMQRRINKLTAERELTKKENEELRKQLSEKKVEGLTEEEVQRRAEKLAEDMVKQRQAKDAETQFQKDCDTLQEAAVKTDKEFNKKINIVAQEIAPIPGVMIGILSELDNENGGAVLSYLANNPDEYEAMFKISGNDIVPLSEGRMTAKLIRISDKLKAEAKKPTKERSKLPEPITPITESRDARTVDVLPKDPTKNIEDFVRIRNKQDAERRKARGY